MRKILILSAAALALAFALPAAQDAQAEARAKKLLAPFAGSWDTEFSMPGMPAPSKGNEQVKAMPHGLAVVVTSTADMGPSGPYEGHGLIGYDKKTGKWQHAWTDN